MENGRGKKQDKSKGKRQGKPTLNLPHRSNDTVVEEIPMEKWNRTVQKKKKRSKNGTRREEGQRQLAGL